MFNLISGSLLVQPEVFASVQNLFRKVFDKYDKYNGDKLTVDNFDDNIRLGYVTDGFYLSEWNFL